MKKAIELPEQLGWRDYFQIVATLLMAGLAIYILWQTVFVKWVFPSMIFSVALLLYSLYRARAIWIYFQQRGRRNGV